MHTNITWTLRLIQTVRIREDVYMFSLRTTKPFRENWQYRTPKPLWPLTSQRGYENMDTAAFEKKIDFINWKREEEMKGSLEGEAAGTWGRGQWRGRERAGQEGRLWPSVSVKDNKEGLKRVWKLLVDNSRTNERAFLTAVLDWPQLSQQHSHGKSEYLEGMGSKSRALLLHKCENTFSSYR